MSHPPDKPAARVFFALWPAIHESGALAAWQAPLKQLCGGRAMRGETLHLTLVFIGGIERARLESLRNAAQEVRADGFELCFDRAHYWGRNHIVFAAPDHVPPELGQLVGGLEHSLGKHGFKFDERDHKPHITLLRDARWTGAELKAMQPVCWQIRDFALMESVPQGGLMGYDVLARFPLKAAGCT
jgi:2'-5' RNA ligase